MIPTLYRIAGEHLPAVLHVASRTVGTHGMSIFGDHSDVMACRQTGLAMLCSASVQETAELAAVAHIARGKGERPSCISSTGSAPPTRSAASACRMSSSCPPLWIERPWNPSDPGR